MKGIKLFGMLATVILLAFGLTFFGCDSEVRTEGVPDGENPTVDSVRYAGEDGQGREIEVVFIKAEARSSVQTGDRYEIYLENTMVSHGKVDVRQENVTFTPARGQAFHGSLRSTVLNIASIPAVSGNISGFSSEIVGDGRVRCVGLAGV